MKLALSFAHGINNGPVERSQLTSRVKEYLRKAGLLEKFSDGNGGYNVKAVLWDSTGNFFRDLVLLEADKKYRDEAIRAVKTQLMDAEENLSKQGSDYRHIVVAHSMGEPLARAALSSCRRDGKSLANTAMLSIGGPMSNTNKLYQEYLSWAKPDGVPTLGLREWVAVVNKDDPVCCNSRFFPFFGKGYQLPKGVTENMVVKFPGNAHLTNPLAEHSAYFSIPAVYQRLEKMINA